MIRTSWQGAVLAMVAAIATACGGGGGGDPGPGPTGDPRLDLAASVTAHGPAAAGDTVTIEYTIRNLGTVPSPWVAEIRFGHGTTPWAALTPVTTAFGLALLEPGQSAVKTTQVSLPAGLAGGAYQVAVLVRAGQDGHPENDLGAGALPVTGPACADDAFEADDVPDQARPQTVGQVVQRNFCFDTSDWTAVELQAGEQIGLALEVAAGSASLSITPPGSTSGSMLLTTQTAGVPVVKRYTAGAAGTYLLGVTSSGGSGPGREHTLSVLPARPNPRPIGLYDEAYNGTPVGGVASLRVDLENHGYAMTGPVEVEFVLSADPVLDQADRRLGRRAFPALAEDEWKYLTFQVPIPPDVTPGSWYVLAVVDPDDVLPELVEDDNLSPAATLWLGTPECAGDAFEQDDEPAAATPVQLGVTQARNHCEDGHDWVRITAAAGEAFTAEAQPGNRPQYLSLRVLDPAGVEVAEVHDYNGVVLTFTAAVAGEYRLEAGATSFGDWQDYALTVNRAQPDLQAWAGSMAGTPWVPGGLVHVRLDYQNLSATPSGPFTIGLWLSRDTVLDPGDLLVAEADIAGATRGVHGGPEVAVALPPDLGTGTWWLIGMADPAGLVPELNEANNSAPGWEVQVLAPLCAPDAFEPDDLPAQALPLPFATPQLRNHCDDQRDWTAVQVTAGDPLAVRLDQDDGSGFDVDLYDADGTTFLRGGWNGFFWVADRTGTVLVCAGCDDARASRAPATYRLTADLCPPDAAEPDDAVAAASVVQPGVAAARNQCDGTIDWMKFQATAGRRYSLAVASPSAAARPTARFCDATGFPLATNQQGDLQPAADGEVWIEVRPPMTAPLLESSYTLTLTER